MTAFERVILIVLDSVGIGELPDADKFGDKGSHTLGHIAQYRNVSLPNLTSFGLGNIEKLKGIEPTEQPKAFYGKMAEVSAGKDTSTGHWEITGLKVTKPFNTYPEGFPPSFIEEFEKRIGRKVLGNIPASGTEIIDQFGPEHQRSGDVIVYTSADSVLQIAAHEEVVPLEELYRICEIAREMTLSGDVVVVRVIARPFIGEPGSYQRTPNRKDYSVKPPQPTILNALKDGGFDVIGVGKISDIFADEGITRSIKTKSNDDGVTKTISVINDSFNGLAFTNLVDFDALYGHRRDPEGYAKALEEFDARLPEIVEALKDNDLLIITADHGNDPTHTGTDHTREYVPLFIYSKRFLQEQIKELGVFDTFSDLGATIAHNFNVPLPSNGKSFLAKLI